MEYSSHWESPSNIALVKYWGKTGGQLPMNPSISFTLNHCKTNTRLDCLPKKSNSGFSLDFFYDGNPKPEFKSKILILLERMSGEMSWLNEMHFNIDSFNTFPHSAGIASSASAMSALALCLCSIDRKLNPGNYSDHLLLQRASYVSRLGSGSACRSVYPLAALWGKYPELPESSDLYAIAVEDRLHPSFRNVCDYIFLVNKAEKTVSSTAGHKLMQKHPFREARIKQANENMHSILYAFQNGDWNSFAYFCETEALSLHGLMMSSSPSYILLEPASLQIISIVRKWRATYNLPVCFTIDAGPNIHVLFPEFVKNDIEQLIAVDLAAYSGGDKIIKDELGLGPNCLS